jgi:protein-arginine deiminase
MPGLISVFIDSDRDGVVNDNDVGQRNWAWSADGHGAIVLPNVDKDILDLDATRADDELAKIKVAEVTSEEIPENVLIHVNASDSAAMRFTLYRLNANGRLEYFLGRDPSTQGEGYRASGELSLAGETLYLEARELPGEGFDGLITLEFCFVQLDNDQAYLYQLDSHNDYCVFRVAPWIMTPNTLSAKRVYTVSIPGQNEAFLTGLQTACDEAGVPLQIIAGNNYRYDRWIQDEIEFGYCASPTKILPVVLDSPRNRGLDNFPEEQLIDEDFGHFNVKQRYLVNSLDSFGNLEVSPPLIVNGKQYPLGRIVFGGKQFNTYGTEHRQMMPELRRMLYAQKVQSPIEVFADWLSVGHVDEFMNFIPDTSSDKGFRLMLASTTLCRSALQSLQTDGMGQTNMFEGQKRYNAMTGEFDKDATITIDDYLANDTLVSVDEECQKYINHNQKILMDTLGLDEQDIIYAPVTFKRAHPRTRRVLAFFPDMVNHLILNGYHIIPKPYGPIINGKDLFEEMMCNALPSSCQVRFIDDWHSYHELSGEVHCGTNTLREPFDDVRWWEYMPDGGFNI